MVPYTQGPRPELIAQVLTRSTSEVKTYFVRLQYAGAAPPQALIDSLESRGFFANANSGMRENKRGILVIEEFGRAGRGLFGAWTAADETAALADLRAVFDEQGIDFSPSHVTAPGAG